MVRAIASTKRFTYKHYLELISTIIMGKNIINKVIPPHKASSSLLFNVFFTSGIMSGVNTEQIVPRQAIWNDMF